MTAAQPLLQALAIDGAVDMAALAERQTLYQSIHMGGRALSIGALRRAIAPLGADDIPRTGHLGNWGDIARGRAGAMDFNQAICGHGLGFPLIYSFTQTETDAMARGDAVYLPGSLVQNGRRRPLMLRSWDGTRFVRRGRDTPWFCPFMQAEHDGALVPLVQLHWQVMREISDWPFRLEAALLNERRETWRGMIVALLHAAGRAANPRTMDRDLVGQAVMLDGRVTAGELRRDGDAYWLDDVRYASAEALADAMMLPFLAVTDPAHFFNMLKSLPAKIPVMANAVARLFVAAALAPGDDVVLHLHWGARDMAGYPPRRRGYFTARSKSHSLRLLCTALDRAALPLPAICVALLPAAIFMLCPTSAHPRDADLLAELFHRIGAMPCDQDAADQLRIAQRIEAAVAAWWEAREPALSHYFRARFAPKRGVLHPAALPDCSRPVTPDGFDALTLQQACMIVGALTGLAQPLASDSDEA